MNIHSPVRVGRQSDRSRGFWLKKCLLISSEESGVSRQRLPAALYFPWTAQLLLLWVYELS